MPMRGGSQRNIEECRGSVRYTGATCSDRSVAPSLVAGGNERPKGIWQTEIVIGIENCKIHQLSQLPKPEAAKESICL